MDSFGSEYAHNSLYAFQENKLGLGVELEGRELSGFEDNPSDDSFLFAKLAATAFYDTKHAIYNTAFRTFGSNLRAGYKVEDGQEVFETNFTRQESDNSAKGVFNEAISTLADVVVILPGGSIEGRALSQTSKSQTVRTIKTGVDGAKAAQKAIMKKQAPKALERVDIPKLDPNGNPLHGQKTHAHIKDKSKLAINQDGSYKHGDKPITETIKNWLKDYGWTF